MSEHEPRHSAATRRDVIVRGIGLAGAAAVPAALLAAAPAHAQEDAQTDALKNVIELEQAAQLAYTEAAAEGKLSGDAQALAEELADQEDDHATALETAIEQLGVEAPEAPDSPDGVSALEGFDAGASEDGLIDFFISMEENLVRAYAEASANLTADDLLRSGAQIGGSHAQHLVAWRLLRGDAPAKAAALPSAPSGSEDE
jgi:rubrerythrin